MRRQKRDNAIEQLSIRRSVQSDAECLGVGVESVRVSLVQHYGAKLQGANDVEYVGAGDGLPTARITIDSVQRSIKLDCGARYTDAGTDWMQFRDHVESLAPVNYVEGIGGFLLDVIGVDACIRDGGTDKIFLGVDFMRSHGATMEFHDNEVRYTDSGRRVVIPFKTDYGKNGGAKNAAVCMVKRTQLADSTVTPVEVAVTADDGEQGLFVPTQHVGSVMLAATVTRAKNGKAWVPATNSSGEPMR